MEPQEQSWGALAHTWRNTCSNSVGIHSPVLPTTTLYLLLSPPLSNRPPPSQSQLLPTSHRKYNSKKKASPRPHHWTDPPTSFASLLHWFSWIPPLTVWDPAPAILLSLLEEMYKYASQLTTSISWQVPTPSTLNTLLAQPPRPHHQVFTGPLVSLLTADALGHHPRVSFSICTHSTPSLRSPSFLVLIPST